MGEDASANDEVARRITRDVPPFGEALTRRQVLGLRGTQVTGADGVATFQTIYPGWYQGRAVHIHMKVHVNSSTRHTGQLFFADALNDTVYKTAPYSTKGSPDMSNADDSIFQDAGAASAILEITPQGNGYRGTISVGINQAA
jgi:protocatechuate 3,4-dioxygenase beta subunit